MKKGRMLALLLLFSIMLNACSETNHFSSEQSKTQQEENGLNESELNSEVKALGALSPEEALEYMKDAENLTIIDVATTAHFNRAHFEGAIHIPIEELDSNEEDALYMEIPAGQPVLIHCRLGMVAPGAYERVLKLRNDIPEIAYIDGAPLFEEYNNWLEEQEA